MFVCLNLCVFVELCLTQIENLKSSTLRATALTFSFLQQFMVSNGIARFLLRFFESRVSTVNQVSYDRSLIYVI